MLNIHLSGTIFFKPSKGKCTYAVKKKKSEVHVYIYETTIHPLNFGRSPDQVMSISPIEVTKILRVMSVTQI